MSVFERQHHSPAFRTVTPPPSVSNGNHTPPFRAVTTHRSVPNRNNTPSTIFIYICHGPMVL
jgi:hypothetical protein